MTDGHVTRSEFYSALMLVWLYIMMVIGDLMRIDWRWTQTVMWVASLMVMLVYVFLSFRANRARRTADRPAGPDATAP
jgi:Ca2+/Na+ antiporter